MAAQDQDMHDLVSLPRDGEGPVFNAPWEAQAFAMAFARRDGAALDEGAYRLAAPRSTANPFNCRTNFDSGNEIVASRISCNTVNH